MVSMLWTADISMRMPPLRHLQILPPLLHCLCSITSSLGSRGPGGGGGHGSHPLAIHHFILHCHLSPSRRHCSRHPGYLIHHVSHLLHILLAHSSFPAHHSHHQVSSSRHAFQPLELLGISSHLLPRPPTNCPVPVSNNPSVY